GVFCNAVYDFLRSFSVGTFLGLLLRSWTIPCSSSARTTLPLSSSSKRTISARVSLWLTKRLQIVTARLVLGSRAEVSLGNMNWSRINWQPARVPGVDWFIGAFVA